MTELYCAASDSFRVPAPKEEDWRFTPVEPFLRPGRPSAAPRPSVEDAAKLALFPLGPRSAVFADGRLVPELSRGLEGRLESRPEGFFLRLSKGERREDLIHLLFLCRDSSAPRLFIAAETGSQAAVVEDFVGWGEASGLTNAVTEISLEAGARLEHYRFQREGELSTHAAGLRVRQARDSVFTSHAVSLGAAAARNDTRVLLAEEGAEAALNGLYLARGTQHVDFHTVVDHAAPHGTSAELYKGVLDGSARAVFDGSVVVRPSAQKTDARVYNKNLLLSERGLVNTKPEFKISANDVQCKHGATVGQLSQESLFYLRSRGIGAGEARAMLVYAFASEMVGRMALAPAREALGDLLHARLPG